MANPQNMESVYSKLIAPYVSVIFNGTYWDQQYPRFLSTTEAIRLSQSWRLIAIGDISADVLGSFEFVSKITTFDEPFCLWNSEDPTFTKDGVKGEGVLVMSIDHLPSELALEASQAFSLKNKSFALQLANDTLSPELEGAVITANGKLTKKFEYISDLRRNKRLLQFKVIVCGAGRVSVPCIRELTRHPQVLVTVVSHEEHLVKRVEDHKFPNTIVKLMNIVDQEKLKTFMTDFDLCISLLPPKLHHLVAEVCIATNVHFVSTSYVSSAMEALEDDIIKRGLVFCNGVGLDPGYDMASLQQEIDCIHSRNGVVKSIKSFCGGLVSPEILLLNPSLQAAGYGFSWTPLGVLLAAKHPSTYRENGVIVENECPFDRVEEVNVGLPLKLVGYGNRNSVVFEEKHRIKGECQTFIRGTLRYPPFPKIIQHLKRFGYLDDSKPIANTWKFLWDERTKGEEVDEEVTQAMNVLGFMKDESIPKEFTLLEATCDLLEDKLELPENATDLVVMYHDIEWEEKGKERKKKRKWFLRFEEVNVKQQCRLQLVFQLLLLRWVS
ncbi:hypothetical protein GEMRC1_002418 [Eukaryota sp. GEM-RC1]